MNEALFPRPDRTGLLVIDIQRSLFAAIPPNVSPNLLKNNKILLKMAELYQIPVLYTEQYPRGLGSTIDELKEPLSAYPRFEKTEFSACRNGTFREELKTIPEDIILVGIETHVCILLTALDLLRHGSRVFVPADAVASRTRSNWQSGLDLLGKAGAVVTNTESLVFQRLERASGDTFKQMLPVMK